MEDRLEKTNGASKTKRADSIRKAIRHIWKGRASKFRTKRNRGEPDKIPLVWHPSHWALATMQPRRGGKIMTSKRRKLPNQRCCSLFQIEGYERLLATTSRLCRNLACLWGLRLSRIGRKVLASIDG